VERGERAARRALALDNMSGLGPRISDRWAVEKALPTLEDVHRSEWARRLVSIFKQG
jgi:hypothetical protein